MVTLNLPAFRHQLRQQVGRTTIFDTIRKKYVALTSEEWVRQHFVNYLIHHLKYPKALIRIEAGLRYNQTQRRSDIVVYSREGTPFMVIECKAPSVALSATVFEQVAVYNQSLRAPYMTVTNGLDHYCCRMDYETSTYAFMEAMPEYEV